MLDRLEPNNLKVDAYYLPDDDGDFDEIYIYQNGKLIDRLQDIGTFNEALAERTEKDVAIMTEQNKQISKFDAMMKRDAIAPVAIMKKEAAKQITEASAKEVVIPTTPDDDFMNYNVGDIRKIAIESM